MKQGAMILFFTIVSVIYITLAWYVYSRGYYALENTGALNTYTWIYWMLASSFIVGQILERGNPSLLSRFITHVGSLWLAFFFYTLLFVVLADIIRGINHFIHFIPETLSSGILSGKTLFSAGAAIAFIITAAGAINARLPHTKHVEITIHQKRAAKDRVKIVFVSDMHLGVLLRNRTADRLIRIINSQKPDLLLFGGDLVDHNPVPVVQNNIGKHFEEIEAPMGVFAVTGNHEFIGNADVSLDYFKKHGVRYIRDSIQTIDGVLQIAGRNDKQGAYYTGQPRKPLGEILNERDPNLPLILLDHQPVEYEAAVKREVDLMLSGHTHKGQLWPLNLITKRVYENHYGLLKKENTWFYTSCGYGTWGPPVRTGNRPEVLVFDVRFE